MTSNRKRRRKGKDVTEHRIEYSDGDFEWLYLPEEKIEIVTVNTSSKSNKKDSRPDVDTPPRPRRL